MLKKKIKIELDQTDAAIVAVLLAEQAGRLALNALLADEALEIRLLIGDPVDKLVNSGGDDQ